MSPELDRPASMSAEVHILLNGYLGDHTASTVAFVRDGAVRVIIDPGMVPDPRAMLDPLAALGESPAAITDVKVLLLRCLLR
jgi:glyoxylase-like metal-dependent hydrolase (beta-lactamase superfamily II)